MLQETYKDLGQSYTPTQDDVKSYMRMVDKDGDGKLNELVNQGLLKRRARFIKGNGVQLKTTIKSDIFRSCSTSFC